MKFAAAATILALMSGVVSANNATGNTTATTGPAVVSTAAPPATVTTNDATTVVTTTPPPAGSNTTTGTSVAATFSMTLSLPGNVTQGDMTSLPFPANGYVAKDCADKANPAWKVACNVFQAIESAIRVKWNIWYAESPRWLTVVGTGITAGARRSLSETTARKLANASLAFAAKITSASADTAASARRFINNDDFANDFATALGSDYGDVVVTVSGVQCNPVCATYDDRSSNAMQFTVGSVAIILSIVSLF